MEDNYKKYAKSNGKLDYDVLWGEIRGITGFMAKKRREEHYYRVVEWFGDNRQLNERKEQKRKDDAFSEKMKESMKKLAEGVYASTEVKLDVVLELERRSKEARKQEDGEEEKSPPSVIDIRLRESLRIMTDWLRYRADASGAVAEEPTPIKES